METITTGSSNERIIRTVILMIVVDVFAVYFLYDGYVGYAQQNRGELARVLGVNIDDVGPTRPDLTAEHAEHVLDQMTIMGTVIEHGELTVEEGERFLDQRTALAILESEPTIVHEDHKYFLGPGGWLRLKINATDVEWVNGPHTASDIQWQRNIGWALVVVSILVTAHALRVFGARATLSEHGLKITGRPLIAWEEIHSLKRVKLGVVDLEYEANGSRRGVRLDDYVCKDLARITAQIAARKGIDDPFAPIPQA